ncbi:MAG: type II toxin-antitoxin system HicA family toxin [Mariprofundaceae bacterium]|nr:type II toxin-antitoxin system HicA family toxin [Mariprofundaceae bacterium]
MLRKIKALIAELKNAGFTNRGGKGSHRNFEKNGVNCTISGKKGADAKHYQEKDVAKKISEAKT